jgi:hypothetical protein
MFLNSDERECERRMLIVSGATLILTPHRSGSPRHCFLILSLSPPEQN